MHWDTISTRLSSPTERKRFVLGQVFSMEGDSTRRAECGRVVDVERKVPEL